VKVLSGGKKHDSNVYDQHHQGHGHKHEGPAKHHSKGMNDVAQFGQTVLQSGLLGRKGQYAGKAMGVANADTSNKSGGLLGTAAASGLLGHKGRMAAHAMGMGKTKGQGGISAQSVLGSGLLGSKGIVAGAALNLVKGRSHK